MLEAGATATFRWAAVAAAMRRRPCRVMALAGCIVVLSLADLYMTLVHLLHFGMLEANPVARQIILYGSPAGLILWKLVTVGIAVGIFVWKRDRRTAEWGAAFCCCALVWLTARWVAYNMVVSRHTHDLQAVADSGLDSWVSMRGGSVGQIRRSGGGGGTLTGYDAANAAAAGVTLVDDGH